MRLRSGTSSVWKYVILRHVVYLKNIGSSFQERFRIVYLVLPTYIGQSYSQNYQ